jgi:hypothetical protein
MSCPEDLFSSNLTVISHDFWGRYKRRRPIFLRRITRTKMFSRSFMQMQPTPAQTITPSMRLTQGNIQDRTPPNGVLSFRSSTKSFTLFRYRANRFCFSSVVLVASLSLSARFLPAPVSVRLLNAPASLLGLRCSMAGTETVLFAEGMEGVSGMR